MPNRIERVVSGGQTRVDRAAFQASATECCFTLFFLENVGEYHDGHEADEDRLILSLLPKDALDLCCT